MLTTRTKAIMCEYIIKSHMLILLVLAMFAQVAFCDEGKADSQKDDLSKLQGRWIGVAEIFAGEKRVDINNMQIIISGNSYEYFCEYFKSGKYTSNNSFNEGHKDIDLLFMNIDKGNVLFKGIYKNDQNKLVLCYSLGERPTRFFSSAEVPARLEIWERSDDRQSTTAIEGAWTLKSQTLAGRAVSSHDTAGQTMLFQGGDFKIIRKHHEKGTIIVNSNANYKIIDIFYNSERLNRKMETKGIYSLCDDVLKICYSLSGNPRPTELLSKPGESLTFREFRRTSTQHDAGQKASEPDTEEMKGVGQKSSNTFFAPGWLNRRVIVKVGTVLKVGDRVVAEEKPGSRARSEASHLFPVYVVNNVNESWLWLVAEHRGKSGWVKADQVVPIEKAIDYFTDALRVKPSSELYIRRGWIWGQQGDFDKQIRDCTDAIRLDPKNEIAYLNRGIAYFRKRDYDKAIADFDAAIQLAPKDARAYSYRAFVWDKKQQYDKAITDYSEAIRLNPQDAAAYYNRGNAWYSKSDYDKAIADFGEAIRLNSNDAKTFLDRGFVWMVKHDYDKAIADYTEAIRLDPKRPEAWFSRGRAWVEKHDYDKAIADYTEAIRLDPKDAMAYARRGYAWDLKGDLEKARRDLDEAERLSSSKP